MLQKHKFRFAPEPGARALIVTLCMAICVGWLYRYQLLNGFALLAGDRYDGVIAATILEHWYKVFQGTANWAEVNYFYPHVLSLANTDGYFIVGLIYIPFRLFGMDPFISAELANMTVKAIGYAGMYWMCRRVFSLPFQWAIMAAVLFTLSNGMTTHSARAQLATVALAPYMAVLLWRAGEAVRQGNFPSARRFGALAGVLYGAWCLTCFYAAWFFLYFSIVFAVIALLVAGKAGVTLVKQQMTRHAGSYLFVLAVALLSLAPFLYAFYPKSQETGVRAYAQSLEHTVVPENILQLGTDNLFVGKVYNQVLLSLEPGYRAADEYYNTGFGILLVVLFILAALRIVRREREDGNKLVLALMLATVLTWLTTLNINGYSLWYGVFYGIPGARALRVVSVYYLFLALPIIVIVVRYLAARRLALPLAALVAALLILEELNTPALGLIRKVEMERIALPSMPPAQCKAFYASGWRDQAKLASPAEFYAHNVTAMLIAQQANIPTVNGFASFMAPDWDFASPEKADYDARVLSYASKNSVNGLCRLDLDTKTWAVIDPAKIRSIPLPLPFFEKTAWDGGIAKFRGLSGEEPWGRWSDAKVVTFQFTGPLPPKFELHITGHAYADNIGKDFIVALQESESAHTAPAGPVQKFSLPRENAERILRFDNPAGLRTISITVPHPVSPKELGGSGDDRTVGLGLVKLAVIPS